MLAIYCDNILKAGGNGKLTDEAVEKALGKVESLGILKNFLSIGSVRYPYIVYPQVVQLVAYVGDRDLFAEFYRYI